MRTVWEIIETPVVTEKALRLKDQPDDLGPQVLVFKVRPEANKHTIKEAVEAIFKVKVGRVRIVNRPGKSVHRWGRYMGQRQDRKQAYVTLKRGERITEYSEVI
jgi:large subunit ribosomal protein L23